MVSFERRYRPTTVTTSGRSLELQNRPAATLGYPLQAPVGIYGHRIADGFEHRSIGEAVGVSLRLGQTRVPLAAKALDRRHLLPLGNQRRGHPAARLRGVVARKKGVAHDDVARAQGAVEVVESESSHRTAVSCQSSVVPL